MTKNLGKMNLKQILITGILLLAGTNLFAEGIPKVNEEDLLYISHGSYGNKQCVIRCYDTDGDSQGDIKFRYMRIPLSKHWYLYSFAIDKDRNNKFTENEWTKIQPPSNKILDNDTKNV